MALDQTTLETQLAAVQSAITAALASGARPDWQVGHVRFNSSSYLKTLLELQESLTEQLRSLPSESIDTHQHRIDALGRDGNEYHHEENP